MAVTGTYTNLEICEDAMRKAGILGIEESAAEADEIDLVKRNLNRMLKAWQAHGYMQHTIASQSVVLSTSASYTLSPVRPVRIHNVNFRRSSIDTPMTEFTRNEYDTLPNKASTGQPTCWYYDKQREAALLYVWPVMSSVSGETLEITYEREIEDVVLSEEADVPGEWYDAVVYGLASRILSDFGEQNQLILARAEAELDLALSADREGSVFFAGPYA